MTVSKQVIRRRKRAAFTLTELLVVMGIIALLAALMLGVSASLRRRAQRDATRTLIDKVELALEEYQDRMGKYPDEIGSDPSDAPQLRATNNAVAALLYGMDEFAVGTRGGHVAEIVQDPPDKHLVVDAWGNPLNIIRDGHNRPALDIWSNGADGASNYNPDDRHDHGDDIVNWDKR